MGARARKRQEAREVSRDIAGDGFWEDDEPAADVRDAFDDGVKGITGEDRCWCAACGRPDDAQAGPCRHGGFNPAEDNPDTWPAR